MKRFVLAALCALTVLSLAACGGKLSDKQIEVCGSVREVLNDYFTGERLGGDIHSAKLASLLYGAEGVENCHLLTPAEDLTVSATQLPILGTVTLTEIGAEEA